MLECVKEASHRDVSFAHKKHVLLRSAVAGRIYKLCAKNTSNSGLTEPLCRAQASFYALPNNERGTKYRGLTYSARQNCP